MVIVALAWVKQIISTKYVRSIITGEQFTIKYKVNCKTKKRIYLTACILRNDHQYVGKFETAWNGKLYNHRKDAHKEKSLQFDEHFKQPGHNFTEHAKFTITEALTKHVKTETDHKRLKEREDYWIARLKTQIPDGFNEQYNSSVHNKIQHICT